MIYSNQQIKGGEKMEQYAMYVRKSRYDRDYADSTLEETLHRHKVMLDAIAKSQNLCVAKVYEEVVSGESISQRPEMQKLLEDVSSGLYAGVLVVDIDRLSRGNSIDQGIVGQTFKYSNTKIITPNKTYDPNDDFDEEYFEFSLFMSRKEYKIINKRLERGRKQSAKEGRFMGSIAPYGFERVKIKGDKGYTLKILEEEAQYGRLMYKLYNHDRLGYSKIANKLNSLCVPTRSGVPWNATVVKTILHNCANAGLIRCSRRKKIKTMINGKVITRSTNLHDYPIYEGLHEGFISREEWEMVTKTAKENNRGSIPLNYNAPLQNYYAGIVFCKNCGTFLTRLTAGRREPRLGCRNTNCNCVSATFREVDEAIVKALKNWLNNYKKTLGKKVDEDEHNYESFFKNTDSEISKVQQQLDKCFTFLEQDVYTVLEFQKRKAVLDEQLQELQTRKNNVMDLLSEQNARKKKQAEIIPIAENLLKNWKILSNEEKNDLLKQVVKRISYYKVPNAAPDDFSVDLFQNI